MPSRLRPTASLATDAILVGDPGRALLLAQELLTEPKMSNHARGLWGYTGKVAACRVDHRKRGSTRQAEEEEGRALTIQSTGMGGPSAALVLGDLVELGVRRAIRVGTCTVLAEAAAPGDLLVVGEAIAVGHSAGAYGVAEDRVVAPDAELTERLAKAVGGGRTVAIASLDAHPADHPPPGGAIAADLQTATVLARAAILGIRAAAVVIASEATDGRASLEPDALQAAEKVAGQAALSAL